VVALHLGTGPIRRLVDDDARRAAAARESEAAAPYEIGPADPTDGPSLGAAPTLSDLPRMPMTTVPGLPPPPIPVPPGVGALPTPVLSVPPGSNTLLGMGKSPPGIPPIKPRAGSVSGIPPVPAGGKRPTRPSIACRRRRRRCGPQMPSPVRPPTARGAPARSSELVPIDPASEFAEPELRPSGRRGPPVLGRAGHLRGDDG
jgi:hypothetical protein